MADAPNATGSDAEDDAETEGDAGDYTVEAAEEAEISDRDVVVPLPLYKVITVFSTLIAGVAVVGGFIVLDEATQRASVQLEDIDPLLALLGLFMIAGGGAMYAFSGRFRAPGMGTTKTDENESPDNG